MDSLGRMRVNSFKSAARNACLALRFCCFSRPREQKATGGPHAVVLGLSAVRGDCHCEVFWEVLVDEGVVWGMFGKVWKLVVS